MVAKVNCVLASATLVVSLVVRLAEAAAAAAVGATGVGASTAGVETAAGGADAVAGAGVPVVSGVRATG